MFDKLTVVYFRLLYLVSYGMFHRSPESSVVQNWPNLIYILVALWSTGIMSLPCNSVNLDSYVMGVQ